MFLPFDDAIIEDSGLGLLLGNIRRQNGSAAMFPHCYNLTAQKNSCDALMIRRANDARGRVRRIYLHRVVHCIVHGWPQAKIRDLLPDRMLAAHPELYIGDPNALPMPLPHASS
jgi:hypothetical protein